MGDVNFTFSSDIGELLEQLKQLQGQMGSLVSETDKIQQEIKETFGSGVNNVASYQQELKGINKTMNDEYKYLKSLKQQRAAASDPKAIKQLDRAIKSSTIQFGKLNKEASLLKKGIANVKGLEKQMTKVNKQTDKSNALFKKLLGTVAAVFSVRAVIKFGSEAVKVFDKQAKAEAKLLVAMKGRSDLQRQLLQQASELQNTTRFGDEETIEAQSRLARFLKDDVESIKELTPLVQDLATGMNMDLATAADLVAKTIGSETNALSRYGIMLDGTMPKQEKIAELARQMNEQFGGQAAAAAKAGAGVFKQISNNINDIKETVGEVIAESPLADWFNGIVKSAKDYMAVPISRKMEEEKVKVNVLVNRLTNQNISATERNKIYGELNRIAPQVLKGIDKENISIKDLTRNLKEYNKTIINEIIIQKNRERIAKIVEKQTDALEKQTDASFSFAEAVQKASDAIDEQGQVFYKGGGKTETLAQKYDRLIANGNDFNAVARIMVEDVQNVNNRLGSNVKYTSTAAAEMFKLTGLMTANNDVVVDLAQRYDNMTESQANMEVVTKQVNKEMDIFNALSANTQGIFESEDKDPPKDLKTALELMQEEISNLETQLDNQVFKGDMIGAEKTAEKLYKLNNAMDEFTKKVQDLKDKIYLDDMISGMPLGELLTVEPDLLIEPKLTVKDADGNYIQIKKNESWLNKYLSGSLKQEKEGSLDFYQELEGYINIAFNTNLNKEQIKGLVEKLKEGVSKLIDVWADYYKQQSELAEQNVNDVRSRREQVLGELNAELQANQQGLASNVELKRQELNRLSELEKEALKNRAAAQKKEQVIQSLMQGINLATAASNILAQSTKLGPIGLIVGSIAIAALLQMFKSFKTNAGAATQFAKGTGIILGGASHSKGGVNLGEVGEAEGGEFLGIASKKATRKHGSKLIDLFDAINSGNEAGISAAAAKFDKGMIASSAGIIFNLDNSKYLKGIYDNVSAPKKVEYFANGYKIVKNGNVTRKIRV